jgi:endonuclease YncB( thermonuclease family)
MRARVLALCLAGLGLTALVLPAAAPAQAPARQRARPDAACERIRSEDVIRSVSPPGEVALASGRKLRLLDLRLPDDADEAPRAAAVLASLADRRVTVAAVGEADRWGRLTAELALLDDAAPIDVAELLVGEGFALVDAGERDALCRPELLAVEARARQRRLGLWATERYRPAFAGDGERLKGLVGRFGLVEGRVRSVGERRERTYLNFGPDWQSDLTVIIPKRTWAVMQGRGLSAAALRGRRVRARGIFEEWQGVAVEIAAADMLELLGQDRP